MRKRSKKLGLSRETLRLLSTPRLVVGGETVLTADLTNCSQGSCTCSCGCGTVSVCCDPTSKVLSLCLDCEI